LRNSFATSILFLARVRSILSFDPPDDDLTNEPPGWVGKTFGPLALANQHDPIGGDCAQQGVKPSAPQDYVVAGEGDAYFVVAALGIDELIPRNNHRLPPEHDFQRWWLIGRAHNPRRLIFID
jgi:hypothetical protein